MFRVKILVAIVLSCLLCTCSNAELIISTTNFPDEIFRECIRESFDVDRNGALSDSELAAVKRIDVQNRGITSLRGIEYFTVLQELLCGENKLKELNLSKNVALNFLRCQRNQLNVLDISMCVSLDTLFCYSNDLGTTLDVSKNTLLTKLYCRENKLTALDVSKNRLLTNLECQRNQLTALDVRNNTALTDLRCFNNQLSELDVSMCLSLDKLYCHENSLGTLDVRNNTALTDLRCTNNQLSELDVSMCLSLDKLYCYENSLDTLDVSRNVNLTLLSCRSNDLTALDVSNNTALNVLDCSRNNLTALDVSRNTALTELYCRENNLTALDLSKNTALTKLYCRENNLTALDLSRNTNLTLLSCYSNNLTALDVSKNTALTKLYCHMNNLTALDVRNNTALIDLACNDNQLSNLDVSKNIALTELNCHENNLTALYVNKNPKLKSLSCSYNSLSALDLTNNPELEKLWCGISDIDILNVRNNNKLTLLSCPIARLKALDTSQNPALTELYCYNNEITALDLSRNVSLDILSCANNQFTELNISKNRALTELDCGGNFISKLDTSGNSELRELNCVCFYLGALDVSSNKALISLDISSSNITAIDLSNNSALSKFSCQGIRIHQDLDITPSRRKDFPYQADIRQYLGNNVTKIISLDAYTKDGTEIPSQFNPSEGIVRFASSPVYLVYEYPTGYTGTASEDSVPHTIKVKLSIPTSGWIYIHRVEPRITNDATVDPSDDVKAPSNTHEYEEPRAENYNQGMLEYIQQFRNMDIDSLTPQINKPQDFSSSVGGGSGGGCDTQADNNSGFVLLIISGVVGFTFRRKHKIFLLGLLFIVASGITAAGNVVRPADYILPMPFNVYTPAGTWTTDFTLTQEAVNNIAEAFGINAENVHLYKEIIQHDTWNFRPVDMGTVSDNGRYAGVMLPVTDYMTSGDVYVLKCTFSNDIEPKELIAGVLPFEVNPDTGNTFYDATKSYFFRGMIFDENFTAIEYVPENRTVYIAVSLHTNTGVLCVVRGKYVEEEDPILRLESRDVQRIADEMNIASSDLKYLTRANISKPVDPTQEMKNYAASFDQEIIVNLPTVSVDIPGMYIIPITLSGDVWEMLKDKDLKDYQFYGFPSSDSDFRVSQDKQVKSSLISGIISTWEIFTLKGERMTSFGVKEFLMIGLLDAGKPFSLYLAKILLALLMGGCHSGIASSAVHVILSALIILEIFRKH